MSSTGNNRNNWREPSAQHCQKYGLRPLPDDFEPTEEEELLLEGYDYVRQYERIAQRLKTEAAMKKLAEKDAAFQEAKTNKRRRKKKKSRLEKDTGAGAIDNNNNNAASDEDEADEYSESDDSEREEDLHRRREEKLQAMRDEVQQAKQAERKEEELIAEHLAQGEQEDDTTAPTILKRRLPNESAAPSKSLISNITSAATPPHDFSKSLELTPARGKTLFPTEPDQIKWSPPEGVFSPLDGAFCVELDNFDANNLSAPTSNNTLAIKFMAPADAQRFSLNIASAADRTEFESILFHFNPRQFERGGQLVVNDKNDGIWGQALAIPLSQVPLLFGQTACTLIIQVHGDGFDIFLEGQHCARLEHRQELPTGQNLVLQFPSTDDYGAPENWVVYKVRV